MFGSLRELLPRILAVVRHRDVTVFVGQRPGDLHPNHGGVVDDHYFFGHLGSFQQPRSEWEDNSLRSCRH